MAGFWDENTELSAPNLNRTTVPAGGIIMYSGGLGAPIGHVREPSCERPGPWARTRPTAWRAHSCDEEMS